MKLVSFSVSNYRSISKANKLKTGPLTSLVGPNNEGKSNILRALVIALEILESVRVATFRGGRMRYAGGYVERYNWELDYPIARQAKYPDGKSRFDLEFQLSEAELADFRSEIRSNLNGTLPVRIEIGGTAAEFTIVKPGRGKAPLMKKRDKIIKFLSARIGLAYIPAVRTAKEAEEVVNRLVSRALQTAERSDEYREALKVINRLQQPVLDSLGDQLTGTLNTFLPSVTNVTLEVSQSAQSMALRRGVSVVVDDGSPTTLARKGDGVQSLAALALIRYVSEWGPTDRELILAIEEPESHLHPQAIHELRSVLREVASKSQVILTTHNPLFVNRERIGSNILVRGSKAVAASSIEEIRETLGVRASDNLRHAEIILVVEGKEDANALGSILPNKHPLLEGPLSDGTFAIETLGGGSNLSYKLSEIRSALCMAHCFLDNDKCAIDAFEKARMHGLANDGDITFTICAGRKESEMEDLLATDLYEEMILNKYGVSITHKDFKGKKKWSDRMGAVFQAQGKRWTEALKAEVKYHVSELATEKPSLAIEPARESIIDALANALLGKLQSIKAVT